MKQPIYEVIDEEFEGFVKGNRKLLEKMPGGSILELKSVDRSKLCNLGLFEYPFHVTFIGKISGGEGPLYHFFNENMDKIYTLCDVM